MDTEKLIEYLGYISEKKKELKKIKLEKDLMENEITSIYNGSVGFNETMKNLLRSDFESVMKNTFGIKFKKGQYLGYTILGYQENGTKIKFKIDGNIYSISVYGNFRDFKTFQIYNYGICTLYLHDSEDGVEVIYSDYDSKKVIKYFIEEIVRRNV